MLWLYVTRKKIGRNSVLPSGYILLQPYGDIVGNSGVAGKNVVDTASNIKEFVDAVLGFVLLVSNMDKAVNNAEPAVEKEVVEFFFLVSDRKYD